LLMKEKAGRAQERRELADLWPADHLMPTLLMRYRALSTEERDRRVEVTKQRDASRALSIEIRANVAQSRMWEIKYDDYGRQFYQHMFTGESCEEMPEIMNYKPPPGRDEMGNVVSTEETDSNYWILFTDNRGQVYYRHRVTNVVTYIPPFAYQKVPAGKTREQLVAEGASIVISYIREKIEKHIAIKTKRKLELENPLTFEEQRKKEKAERNRTAEEIAAAGPELTEEGESIDLSLFQYDIETVEMLAAQLTDEEKKVVDKDPEEVRKQKRPFFETSDARKFDETLFIGKLLKQWDAEELTIPKLRSIMEELALGEEKLEKQLVRTRQHIKEYSFLLQEKSALEDSIKFGLYKEQRLEESRLARVEKKRLLIERMELAKTLKVAKTATKEDSVTADEGSKKDGFVVAVEEDEQTVRSQTLSQGVAESTDDLSSTVQGKVDKTSNILENSIEDALLPIDNDDRQVLEAELQSTKAAEIDVLLEDVDDQLDDDVSNELSDEHLRLEMEGNPATKLFGDLALESLQTDFSNSIAKLAKQLSNFAIFCGFNNLNASKLTLDSNHNFCLVSALEAQPGHRRGSVQPQQAGHDELKDSIEPALHQVNHEHDQQHPHQHQDDEWMTAQFFLNCSKDDLAVHSQVLKQKYDNHMGMLPIGPLNPDIVIFDTEPALISRAMVR
jgi:hypothetical protein